MTAPTTTVATAGTLAALDAAYRASQARTAIAVARILFDRWGNVEPDDLAGTGVAWMRDAIAAVLAGQGRARGNADAYVAQIRRLQAPGAAPFTPPPPKPPNEEQIRKSLEYTGFNTTGRELFRVESVRKSSTEDLEADVESEERTAEGRKRQIMEDGISRAAAAAVRHITTAGQDRIHDLVQADPVAVGYARTTKPGCCYFCAMLASRGFVYKEDSFDASDARFSGPGDAKVHDSCGCGLRPAYSRVDPRPARSDELEELWTTIGENAQTGETVVQTWRRIYEASPLAATADPS